MRRWSRSSISELTAPMVVPPTAPGRGVVAQMLACDGTQGADKVPRKPQRILVSVDVVDHRFYRLLVSLTELRNGPGGQRLLVEVFLGTIAFSPRVERDR